MYDYRNWTREQQAAALAERKQRGFPRHSPPHPDEPGHFRLITGTCCEHAHILTTHERLAWFENELLTHIREQALPCAGCAHESLSYLG
jgi:putative transposase